jgi:hypothetical protein
MRQRLYSTVRRYRKMLLLSGAVIAGCAGILCALIVDYGQPRHPIAWIVATAIAVAACERFAFWDRENW